MMHERPQAMRQFTILMTKPFHTLRIWVLSGILFVPLAACGAQSPLAYPPALRGDAVDDYNGVRVADPYRWLEQLDSAETRDWVKAQARLTDSYLERIPARQVIRKRLTELLNFEKYGMPFHAAGRYFYSYNSGLQDQNVLCMVEGLSGAPKVVLDPNL